MNEVVRAGDTVRRPSGPWTSTVHEVLRRLHLKGIEGVPQAYDIDDAGRESLDFVPGSVPSYPMPVWIWEDSFLVTAAGRLREFHDATAGLNIVDAVWKTPVHEPAEVVCHNDFAPYNFVCRDGQFSAVIDWDTISPGPRIWDVAYLAYRLCPLTAPTNPDGRPGISCEDQGRRLGRLLGAYADFTASEALIVAVERLEDLARFTAAEAQRQSRSDLAGHVNLYMNDVEYLQTAGSSIVGAAERGIL
ncbi:phosphotransferase [Arthrobacter sp. MMS18-M83]|uniref:phosphotransferase n=1 Tax=Arthrobacter sp. MMS18-M83 TaxID=2996261 RepID=UPI00227A6FC1|nr:phosphotransferase [Arthrobacter sp. MMS18-M83]WAH95236.1 phosphotransferase [Arthrobacter sp. MMS18-M83]